MDDQMQIRQRILADAAQQNGTPGAPGPAATPLGGPGRPALGRGPGAVTPGQPPSTVGPAARSGAGPAGGPGLPPSGQAPGAPGQLGARPLAPPMAEGDGLTPQMRMLQMAMRRGQNAIVALGELNDRKLLRAREPNCYEASPAKFRGVLRG